MMKKTLLFISIWFFLNSVYGQINFEDKVNIYDLDSLSINIIYDDFDNDGDLDLIKYIPNNNVLLQKNENGDFNSKLPKLIATGKSPIISLDLNNDGFPDLITYRSYNIIGVLYNLQNDTFSEEETILSFSGSYTIQAKFDYNSDGFMDLIVTNISNETYVLLNNQIGGFEPLQFIGSLGNFNSIHKIADFDNDGDFDFYIKDSNYLKIYLNNNGSFEQPNILKVQSPLRSFGILDIDENGFKDIVYWKSGAIWVKYFDFDEIANEFIVMNDIMEVDNIPFYTFSNNRQSIYIENEGSGNYAVYVALETTQNNYNIYKFNIQNGVFSNPQIVLSNFQLNIFTLDQINFLDLNNVGNLDFTFTSNFNQQKMILINYNINGSLDKTICIQQSIIPNTFTAIDMNGDGIEDVCFGTQKGLGYIEKITNNELGDIRNLIGVMSNPNASTFAINHIVDFDNDGLGDVIDFVDNGNYAKVFRNLGDDNFEYVQNIPVTQSLTRFIYFVDIDSDGFLDILFENIEPSNNYSEFNWAKNNNGISFENPQPLVINNSGPFSAVSLAFDDFNNDNQTDILLLFYYFENNQFNHDIILLENENGQFFSNTIASLDGNYSDGKLKIKDFDQDGDLDFFVSNNYNDQPFLCFRNNGQNNFDVITIENNNIEDIEFDDNDNDGIYEIYAWNYDTSSYLNHIFYYTTTDYLNYFRNEIDSYTAYYDSSGTHEGDLFLYDIDNDGKKELFISNFSFWEGLISVYKNISGTLGIEDIENGDNLNQLKLYPNPFATSIFWNGQENKNYTLQLFTLSGKLLYKIKTSNNSLDLSAIDSGIYLFVIEDDNLDHKWVYKIIKK